MAAAREAMSLELLGLDDVSQRFGSRGVRFDHRICILGFLVRICAIKVS